MDTTLQILVSLVAVLLVVNVAEGVMLAGLIYVNGDVQRRMGPDEGPLVPRDGLPIGSQAPELLAVDKRSQEAIRLSDHAGKRALVAFLAPGCGPCARLVPDLNRLANDYREVPMIVVFPPGKGPDFGRDLHDRIWTTDDPDRTISEAFDVQRTPLIYLLDEERRIINRTISNEFVDLEDTLKSIGHAQGDAPWVATEPNDSNEPDEITKEPIDTKE